MNPVSEKLTLSYLFATYLRGMPSSQVSKYFGRDSGPLSDVVGAAKCYSNGGMGKSSHSSSGVDRDRHVEVPMSTKAPDQKGGSVWRSFGLRAPGDQVETYRPMSAITG